MGIKSEPERALEWAAIGNAGASSLAILSIMINKPPTSAYRYPRDTADFARCHALLAAVPEWRARLAEMGQVSDEWKALVAEWDKLEALHKQGDKSSLYREMKRILTPIEDARQNLVRLGRGNRGHGPRVIWRQ